MRSRSVIITCALLMALGLSAAMHATANTDSLERRSTRARAASNTADDEREKWQSEYRVLLTALSNAQQRSAVAAYDWRSERKRHRLRGNTRVEADAEISSANEEIESTRKAIQDFYQRARSEGALPGWLYQVEDEYPGIAEELPPR